MFSPAPRRFSSAPPVARHDRSWLLPCVVGDGPCLRFTRPGVGRILSSGPCGPATREVGDVSRRTPASEPFTPVAVWSQVLQAGAFRATRPGEKRTRVRMNRTERPPRALEQIDDWTPEDQAFWDRVTALRRTIRARLSSARCRRAGHVMLQSSQPVPRHDHTAAPNPMDSVHGNCGAPGSGGRSFPRSRGVPVRSEDAEEDQT